MADPDLNPPSFYLDSGSNIFYDNSINRESYTEEPTRISGDDESLEWSIGGNDTIFGQRDTDVIYGDSSSWDNGRAGGDDRLYGGRGHDGIYGDWYGMTAGQSAGDDLLQQGPGYGTMRGDAYNFMNDVVGGNDTLRGAGVNAGECSFMARSRGGNDVLDASGADVDAETVQRHYAGGGYLSYLFGDAGQWLSEGSIGGRDTLTGSRYRDALLGDADDIMDSSRGGSDVLSALGGRDVLYGDARIMTEQGVGGNDKLNGGTGSDTLYGDGGTLESAEIDCGNDSLRGGAGDDELWGDGDGPAIAGNDTFYFMGGFGSDVVMDFGAGDDRLAFQGFDAADVVVDDSGADTIVTVTGGGVVTLVGYNDGLVEGDSLLLL